MQMYRWIYMYITYAYTCIFVSVQISKQFILNRKKYLELFLSLQLEGEDSLIKYRCVCRLPYGKT